MLRSWTRVLLALLVAAGLLVPAGSAVADPAAAAGLTVTGRYAILGDDARSIVLVGQYTCGPYPAGVPDRGVIDMGVNQIVGGVEVVGSGYLTPTVCDGNPQWYAVELTVHIEDLRFRRGPAHWLASGYVEGPGGGQNVYVPPTAIRVR